MRRAVEPLVEAARAKDAELIQRLVDALEGVVRVADRATTEFDEARSSIAAAKTAWFKPSDL